MCVCCCSPEVDWASYTTTLGFREYDEAGALVSDKEYKFDAAYFHDMVVTDKWYIVFDCPIKMDYWKTFIGYPFGLNSLGDTIAGAAPLILHCLLCVVEKEGILPSRVAPWRVNPEGNGRQ